MKTRDLFNSFETSYDKLEAYGDIEDFKRDMDMEDATEDDVIEYLDSEMEWQHSEIIDNASQVRTDGEIIVFAELGLWDGVRTGYKTIGHDLEDVFYSDNDLSKWYIDRYNLRYMGAHHDGRNYHLYREIKEELSEVQYDNFMEKVDNGEVTDRDMTRYTRSLLPRLKEADIIW